MEFATVESRLIYDIDFRRRDVVRITEGDPPLPAIAPAEVEVELGNILVKWVLERQPPPAGTGDSPSSVALWLFSPKPAVADPMTILDPPAYGGNDTKGCLFERFPGGHFPPPQIEQTELWRDYIEPNWDLIKGGEGEVTQSNLAAEETNELWPGNRNMVRWVCPDDRSWTPPAIPLRVCRQGVEKKGFFLALIEIRMPGLLFLLARPMIITPKIEHGKCFIATATYGSIDAPEVEFFRRWRDESLASSAVGRSLTRAYYAVSPPMAAVVTRSNSLRSLTRRLLDAVARSISGTLKR
jgi:hypothetical protein